jgi:glycosyltransferase involved in cell wall biosynthesis
MLPEEPEVDKLSDADTLLALRGVRICVIYDCLFPMTVGGAERWYRDLSDAFVAAGADVTYLTRRQWTGSLERQARMSVIPVSGPAEIYDHAGTRRLGPTLLFGWGVFRYLIRRRSAFDIVHLANFPFFPLLAVRLALAGTRTRVTVDWIEVWSAHYWRGYAGSVLGTIGFAMQRLCIALTTTSFVFASWNARQLIEAGVRRPPIVLAGLLPAEDKAVQALSGPLTPPVVLFAGRHIRDKGIDLLPDILAAARLQVTDLTMTVAGDGPCRVALELEFAKRGLAEAVRFVGFVSEERFTELLASAACLVMPSRREGYGMLAVEAAAYGTPTIVAGFPENSAAEHIKCGLNGFVVRPPTVEGLAEAVVEALRRDASLRQSTASWYLERAEAMTISHSVAQVIAAHSTAMRIRRTTGF